MNNWTEEVDKLLHVAHYCTTLGMNRKFAYNLVDRSLRAASDVLSAQCTMWSIILHLCYNGLLNGLKKR